MFWADFLCILRSEDRTKTFLCSAAQNVSDILAIFVPSICAELHSMFLTGTYEWGENVMTMSNKSRCIRCTRWVKMAQISCFLETAKMFLNTNIFAFICIISIEFSHVINIFENNARVSSKLSFQFSRFVSSFRNISGTKKFPWMNFIECYYVKYTDFAAHDISGQNS